MVMVFVVLVMLEQFDPIIVHQREMDLKLDSLQLFIVLVLFVNNSMIPMMEVLQQVHLHHN